MTGSLTKNTLAIIAGSPLTRLGMAQFIDELHPDYHCVLSAATLSPLSEQYLTSLRVLIVDMDGAQGNQARMAQQLLLLGDYYPRLHIVAYMSCHDIAILMALHVCKNISLIARQETPEQLRYVMTQVLEGLHIFSPCIKESLKQQCAPMKRPASNTLTESERNVLTHLYSGLSLTDIAKLCHCSIKTISAHKRNSMRKLGIHSDAQLFQIAFGDVLSII